MDKPTSPAPPRLRVPHGVKGPGAESKQTLRVAAVSRNSTTGNCPCSCSFQPPPLALQPCRTGGPLSPALLLRTCNHFTSQLREFKVTNFDSPARSKSGTEHPVSGREGRRHNESLDRGKVGKVSPTLPWCRLCRLGGPVAMQEHTDETAPGSIPWVGGLAGWRVGPVLVGAEAR